MFRLRRPGAAELRRWLDAAGKLQLPPAPPRAGATADHHQTVLGRGAPSFQRACEALRRWEMFRLGWVEIVPAAPPIAVGATVGVLVRLVGFWSLNPCRIVALVGDEEPSRRFGFVYRTLPGHAVEGEEQFVVEWQATDDLVVYDVRAWSRPGLLARLGRPVARSVQRRFARDSLAAMRRAVAGHGQATEQAPTP